MHLKNVFFLLQKTVCNICHDVLMMSIDMNSIATLNIQGVDNCFIIAGITKSEDLNLLRKVDLSKKSGSL